MRVNKCRKRASRKKLINSAFEAWKTVMGMNGYVGSAAHAADVRERRGR